MDALFPDGERVGVFFMHIQLIFMHFILMVLLWEHWAVRCGCG